MGFPNFLVVGAARSGTTALTHFLVQHPEIFICSPKEPHFMAFAGQTLKFQGPGDDALINSVAVTDPMKYESLFRASEGHTAIGDGSVSTLYYHDASITNIRRYAPDAKLISVLRNPVDRAYSSFLYMTARGLEPCTNFMDALNAEEERIVNNWHHIWHYKRMGYYSRQLKAFFDAFGPDQFQCILFEDMKNPLDGTLQKIFTELSVDSSFQPRTDTPINRSGKPRSRLLQYFVNATTRVAPLKKLVKAVVPTRVREHIRQANLSYPKMTAEERAFATSIFEDDIQATADVLQIDLAKWIR